MINNIQVDMMTGKQQQPDPVVHFGVVVSGRHVITEFRQMGPMKFVAEIPNPGSVADLTFFMLPSSPVPPGHGAALYFSVLPYHNWQMIGTVFAEKPSGVFRTSWPTNPEVAGHHTLQLGISIETLDSLRNLGMEDSGLEERKQYAYKIALDLFRYMSSFNNITEQNMMLVPTNILDKWMERFEAKYKRDPNFMLRVE